MLECEFVGLADDNPVRCKTVYVSCKLMVAVCITEINGVIFITKVITDHKLLHCKIIWFIVTLRMYLLPTLSYGYCWSHFEHQSSFNTYL